VLLEVQRDELDDIRLVIDDRYQLVQVAGPVAGVDLFRLSFQGFYCTSTLRSFQRSTYLYSNNVNAFCSPCEVSVNFCYLLRFRCHSGFHQVFHHGRRSRLARHSGRRVNGGSNVS
jgi:hypothetical protein